MGKKKKKKKKVRMPKLYQSGGYSYDDQFYNPDLYENEDLGSDNLTFDGGRRRSRFSRFRDRFNDVREPLAVGANFLQGANLSSPRPSLINSAVLGGISGGLSGGLPGLIFGGVSGLINAGQTRTAEDELNFLEERSRFRNSRVSPNIAKHGGAIKEGAVNTTGYKKGAESSKRPFNIIPGNHITMKGVDIPILAIPNKGKAKRLNPGDKDVKFKDAKSVLEIPILQAGGDIDLFTGLERVGATGGFDVDDTFATAAPVSIEDPMTAGARKAPRFTIPTDTVNNLVLGRFNFCRGRDNYK